MRVTQFLSLLIIGAVLTSGAMGELVLNSPVNTINPVMLNLTVGATTITPITSAERTAVLQNVLNTSTLSAADKTAAVTDFAKLPVEAQDAVLAQMSPAYAVKVEYPTVQTTFKFPVKIDLNQVLTPKINELSPSSTDYSHWVVVKGSALTSDCVVRIDGMRDARSLYWQGLLTFAAPFEPLGSTHTITVVNTARNLTSNSVSFKVVAPRNYRGVHGWRFANFSTPTLSWNIYRDYFTPLAVEFSDGTHRAAAQAWFDAGYKYAGSGGDCFGMSMRSIRTRLGNYAGLHASWWPGNLQPTVWNYPWTNPQIADSIREDQGGQLCAQTAALINDRWNNQTNLQAAWFMWSALFSGDPARQPVMGMWYNGHYGHAVVGHQMSWDGTKYAIKLYDNNKPYSETELNDNGSTAYVQSNNTFSYSYGGGVVANRMIAFSYNELVYSPPLLPTDAGGPTTGLAAGCTIVSFESQTAVQQITDENGRTFFANGQENTNAATRIANSMRYIPMTGAAWPADAPVFFFFNNSTGKNLTFDVAGTQAKAVHIFSPRSVTSLTLQRGQLSLRNIMQPAQELRLTNPNLMGLQDIQLINVQADRTERVFRMDNFRNLDAGALNFSLSPAADALLASGMPAQCNLTINGLSNAGTRTAAVPNFTLQAGRITAIAVPDFNTLQTGTTRLELR